MILTAKFVNFYRTNPSAYAGVDLEQLRMISLGLKALTDEAVKKGLIRDSGEFPDGTGGYAVYEGEPEEVFKFVTSFSPFLINDTHMIIPVDKAFDMTIEELDAKIAMMKQMK